MARNGKWPPKWPPCRNGQNDPKTADCDQIWAEMAPTWPKMARNDLPIGSPEHVQTWWWKIAYFPPF